MKYYRVLTWADGRQYMKWNRKKYGEVVGTGLYMISGELLTERERNKFCNHDKHFEMIELKKSEVYWAFGARFQKGGK